MKKCFKCEKTKNIDQFYNHKQMEDGHLNKCKTCTKNDSNENRNKNIEYYLAYDRIRGSLPHRVKLRKEYRKTEAYRISHNKATKKWDKNNPEKKAAQTLLSNAVKSGKIKRKKCQLCGDPRSQGHHDDYTKPLKVKWLCQTCHKFHHKIEKIKILM